MVELTITIKLKVDNMASLQNAVDAVSNLHDMLDVKIPEIVAGLEGMSPTQEEVDALAASIDAERMRVEDIDTQPLPPTPPVPPVG